MAPRPASAGSVRQPFSSVRPGLISTCTTRISPSEPSWITSRNRPK